MKAVDVKFPLFVFEKNDGSMFLVESRERFLHYLEAIDIENGEYLFWDSTGAGVCVSVARGAIDQIALCDQAMTLPQAFDAYTRAYGLQMSLGQSPLDIWRSLQSQLPPRKTLWAVSSRKNAWVFARETLVYGFIIFVLLACIRWLWHLSFASNLFEIWAVSTIVFAPLLYAAKHLLIDSFKW